MKDKVMYSLLDSNGFVLPIKLGSYCGLDSGWNLAVRRQHTSRMARPPLTAMTGGEGSCKSWVWGYGVSWDYPLAFEKGVSCSLDVTWRQILILLGEGRPLIKLKRKQDKWGNGAIPKLQKKVMSDMTPHNMPLGMDSLSSRSADTNSTSNSSNNIRASSLPPGVQFKTVTVQKQRPWTWLPLGLTFQVCALGAGWFPTSSGEAAKGRHDIVGGGQD